MATIAFSIVGGALGGPFGAALGGIIGREVDGKLFGSANEGPRLKELAVTTSSYGQPIPRIFGRMRTAGTVIWSTDLQEASDTQGGKGRPKTTTYSYSASFAVALSSTPLSRIGRIWADGNLLRGASGDLKVEGAMRLYCGHGDDPVDPLIAADKGDEASAFRDCAYVVFENLQLAEFGNRIPALTFEVFGMHDAQVRLSDLAADRRIAASPVAIDHARGFADDGGAIGLSLSAIDRVLPLACVVDGERLRVEARRSAPTIAPVLPERLSPRSAEDSAQKQTQRGNRPAREPLALRYYDEDRDYQPGVQRANGMRTEGREATVDLPATMKAAGARQLANANAHRARWRSEQSTYRCARIDPSVRAGSVVRLPDAAGHWLVKAWEWNEGGVELELERLAPDLVANQTGDAGRPNLAIDLPASPTTLDVFELPSEDASDPSAISLVAAASGPFATWNGAALFVERDGALVPIGSTASRRAVMGHLLEPLPPSPGLLFEPEGRLSVELLPTDLSFAPAIVADIAMGANRLCVGGEVLQFAHARQFASGKWHLEGLLRGRGGTEPQAMAGHGAGANVALLDDRLTVLDALLVAPNDATRIAAIGRGDPEPVLAELRNRGLSRTPPIPVHPSARRQKDGGLALGWTRRARGQWLWDGLLDPPLVEQAELYRVGYGPVDAPYVHWTVDEPRLTIDPTSIAEISDAHGPHMLWVRQIGSFAHSPAIHLIDL